MIEYWMVDDALIILPHKYEDIGRYSLALRVWSSPGLNITTVPEGSQGTLPGKRRSLVLKWGELKGKGLPRTTPD